VVVPTIAISRLDSYHTNSASMDEGMVAAKSCAFVGMNKMTCSAFGARSTVEVLTVAKQGGY